MNILLTGGAGFIGSAVCRHLCTDAWQPRHQCRQADLCRQSRVAAGDREPAQLPLRAGRHLRRRRDPRRSCCATSDRRGHAPRRRKPCRPLDRRPGGLHRDQRRRHVPAAGRRRSSYWRGLTATDRARFRFHHVSTDEVFGDLPLRRRRLHGRDALRAVLALFGLEGRVRPSRARLARDLRPAGRALQLLQQLRAVPLPRKAHPAGHPQRARGEAAAGLRQGRERARLALSSTTMRARSSAVATQGRRRARATMSAAAPSAPTSRVVETICDMLDEMRPRSRRRAATAT